MVVYQLQSTLQDLKGGNQVQKTNWIVEHFCQIQILMMLSRLVFNSVYMYIIIKYVFNNAII